MAAIKGVILNDCHVCGRRHRQKLFAKAAIDKFLDEAADCEGVESGRWVTWVCDITQPAEMLGSIGAVKTDRLRHRNVIAVRQL